MRYDHIVNTPIRLGSGNALQGNRYRGHRKEMGDAVAMDDISVILVVRAIANGARDIHAGNGFRVCMARAEIVMRGYRHCAGKDN
tara:strand:+ start:2042 stop:2296 length:255 start_codon:yes stop_codon:yes gene_type:complete